MLKRLYVRPSKVDSADHFGEIQPQELKFRFKPKTQISCIVTLTNKSNCHMAFKVKVSDVKTFCARPGVGIIKPHSTCQVQLTRQAQDIVPPSTVIANEKFLFQRAFVPRNTSIKDVSDIFRANEGGLINQTELKVVLDVPTEVIEEQELEMALQELALKLKNLK
nr:vesicle-associated protein 1-2-like [Tanacetum cinerariifolium]